MADRIEYATRRHRHSVRWIGQAMGPGWWHYVLDMPERWAEGSTECGLGIAYEADTVDLPKESRHRLIGGSPFSDHTEPVCDICLKAVAGEDVSDGE